MTRTLGEILMTNDEIIKYFGVKSMEIDTFIVLKNHKKRGAAHNE